MLGCNSEKTISEQEWSMLAANLQSHQGTKIFYRRYFQEDCFYYYANGIVKFTFVDSMVCDYFYYYDDGIVEFTFADLDGLRLLLLLQQWNCWVYLLRAPWFANTFIITTMELLSLPFVDSDGLRLLSGLTFCGGELCITLSEWASVPGITEKYTHTVNTAGGLSYTSSTVKLLFIKNYSSNFTY